MATVAGSSRTLGVLAALAGIALIQPVACNGPGGKGKTLDPAAVGDVLEAVWPEVVEPALADARADLATLADATDAWAVAEAAGDGSVERDAARDAWVDAMASWQRVEVHQLGPTASSLTAIGGEDRRDNIYSWPTTNPCRVDQETVEGNYANAAFFEVELVNVVGLDALEVLLFADDADNSCPPQVAINAEGSWDALGPDGVARARADYAAVLADQLVVEADALYDAWDPAGGDFAGALATAGEGSSPFGSPTEGLNAVFDALFYVETATKDRKLGEPLGLRDCGVTDCLALVETPTAGHSHTWLRANLAGFRALYAGGEGTGMDDLLRDLDEDALADAIEAQLSATEQAADALTLPIDEAAATADPAAVALHTELTELANLLKGDLATALLLQVPAEAAGDND